MSNLFALVMAGGRGTRFWPLSRRARPKQCVSLSDGTTLIQQTVARLHPLIPIKNTLVITGPDMVEAVREQLPFLPPANLLVEPEGRNTAPCVGFGAVEIGRRGGGEAVMAVLPADHVVASPERLRQVLDAAAQAARATNALITLGIRPTRAETGFGYLEVGCVMGTWGGVEFRMVERFTEKPDEVTAARYLSSGRHLWNAGMFVFTVDAVRDAFRNHLPGIAEVLEEVQRNPHRLGDLWGRMEPTSIDYGILERSRHILTVPCDIGWSDIGSWDAASALLPRVEGGRADASRVTAIDSEGCIVHAPGKVVALVGVRNIVVVDTPDALLVVDRDRSQDVRKVIDSLRDLGLDHLT